jgi:hypothetical protein
MLLSVPGKLFTMTLLERCMNILQIKRRVQLAGFMPRRSTVEQIFTMHQLIEKKNEFGRKAYVAFVDFRAAFDSVDCNSLRLILRSTGMPDKYCKLFGSSTKRRRAAFKSTASGTQHLVLKPVSAKGVSPPQNFSTASQTKS